MVVCAYVFGRVTDTIMCVFSYVEAFLFIIIMLHYFLLICDPIYENQQKTIFGAQWTHYAILGIQVIYTYV